MVCYVYTVCVCVCVCTSLCRARSVFAPIFIHDKEWYGRWSVVSESRCVCMVMAMHTVVWSDVMYVWEYMDVEHSRVYCVWTCLLNGREYNFFDRCANIRSEYAVGMVRQAFSSFSHSLSRGRGEVRRMRHLLQASRSECHILRGGYILFVCVLWVFFEHNTTQHASTFSQ